MTVRTHCRPGMNVFAALALLCLIGGFTAAGDAAAQASSEAGAKPVNDACPLSGNPIDPSAPTAAVDGHTIAFCCGGCTARFEKWDDGKKKQYVQTALASNAPSPTTKPRQPQRRESDKDAAKKVISDPYTIDACPVSKRVLSEQEFPFTKMYGDREIRFCCRGCSGLFEKEQEKYIAAIDKQMIKAQLPYYPTDQCVVMDEPLDDMGEPEDIIHNNRLVRLCCSSCVRKFNRKPQEYLAKLDAMVKDKQRGDYPMSTCIIGGKELGSMGEPHEVVIGNRLFRLCCAGCEKALRDNAPKHIAQLDAAWKKNRK